MYNYNRKDLLIKVQNMGIFYLAFFILHFKIIIINCNKYNIKTLQKK